MPRCKSVLQSEYPYHITARCINREWFHLPMDDVWEIFCDELTHATIQFDLKIHSFVLMSNHFHLIASTPLANVSQCMQQFMHRTSRRLTHAGNRMNQTYAGRHYKCILHSQNYYLCAYKYVYRNPVSAGIVDRVESYKYSTLRGKLAALEKKIPFVYDHLFYEKPKQTLEWLNLQPDPTKLDGFRKGLRHQYFKSKKFLNTNKPIIGEYDIL